MSDRALKRKSKPKTLRTCPEFDGYRRSSFGLLPAVLAHGAGVAGFDELVIFGGIGVIILGLIYMSWRAGKKRKRAGGTRRRPR